MQALSKSLALSSAPASTIVATSLQRTTSFSTATATQARKSSHQSTTPLRFPAIEDIRIVRYTDFIAGLRKLNPNRQFDQTEAEAALHQAFAESVGMKDWQELQRELTRPRGERQHKKRQGSLLSLAPGWTSLLRKANDFGKSAEGSAFGRGKK